MPASSARTPRDLAELIDQMLARVPEQHISLRLGLMSIQSSWCYSAPEGRGLCWSRAAKLLEDAIGEPVKEWEKEVAALFMGEGTESDDE